MVVVVAVVEVWGLVGRMIVIVCGVVTVVRAMRVTVTVIVSVVGAVVVAGTKYVSNKYWTQGLRDVRLTAVNTDGGHSCDQEDDAGLRQTEHDAMCGVRCRASWV